MRSKTLALALTIGTSGLAAAQPGPPGPPDGTAAAGAPETPPPPPTSSPPPRAEPEHHMTRDEPETGGIRPSELSFAIGIGYQFGAGTNLENPNTTSVRVRFPSGLTLEPRVTLSNLSQDTDNGTTDNETTTTTFAAATWIKLPLVTHGRVDFNGIGTVGLAITSTDPPGPNDTTTTTAISLGWGIGLGYWINHHWQLSLDATNPLISYSRTSMQTGAGLPDTKMSSTTIGLIFDPTVVLMVHLYN